MDGEMTYKKQTPADVDIICSNGQAEPSSSVGILGHGCPLRHAFSSGNLLLKPHAQDMTRTAPLLTLYVRTSRTRYLFIRAAYVVVLLLLLTTATSVIPDISWRQKLFWLMLYVLKMVLAFGIQMSFPVLQTPTAAEDGVSDSGSCCFRRRKSCPQLVDQHVQTLEVEHQVHTTCTCLVQENECDDRLAEDQPIVKSGLSAAGMEQSCEQECHDDHLAENQQTDNSDLSAAAKQQSDEHDDDGRAAGLQSCSTDPWKESPVQQPRHQSSSIEGLEEISSVEDVATPGKNVSATEQEPPTNHGRRLPESSHRPPNPHDRGLAINGLYSPNFEDLKNKVSCEVILFKQVDASPRNQRGMDVPSDLVKKSLQVAQLLTSQQNPEHLKIEVVEKLHQKLTSFEEETAGKKTSLMKELMTMRSPPATQGQVYMCNIKSDQVDLSQEMSRLVSFALYPRVPESGVWVMQLAAAGFYCPDKTSSVLRCAFCGVEVEIDHFRNRAPCEVHRALSPSCSLMKGEAPNTTLEEQTKEANRHYTTAWFGPGASADPLDAEKSIDDGSQKGRGGAAALPDHPPPSAHHISSGHAPEPCSQSQDQHHRLSPAMASVSNPPPPAERSDRQASGSSPMPSSTGAQSAAAFPPISPTSALCPSTGTERRNSAGDGSLAPTTQSTEQSGSQNRHRQVQEPPRLVEPQSSEPASAQAAASNSRNAVNTSQTFQTARPAERNQDRRTERNQDRRTESGAEHTSTQAAAPNSRNTTQNTQTFQTARPDERTQERTEEPGNAAGPPPPPTSSNESVRQVVTYGQLGIYTQEPKRPDMAIASSRVRTYTNWPHPDTHCPDHMAEAGFYYVGLEDLVRCFYCKGGLKSWSGSLRPWVEHARFYPNCPFVGQVKGQEFIDVVQELKAKQKEISEGEVEEELKRRESAVPETDTPSEDGATEASTEERKGGRDVRGAEGGGEEADVQADDAHLKKTADELESKNQEIQNERMCKICQVEEVSILFLPCGHLVSCSQCAPALRTCAVCRQRVKGRVRVLDDKKYKDMETESEQEGLASA